MRLIRLTDAQVQNVRKAIAAGDKLLAWGFAPYVPHLNMIWDIIFPHTTGTWYELDNVWLAQCEALIRLPGDSFGADEEVKLARSLGIPVYSSVEDFIREESYQQRGGYALGG